MLTFQLKYFAANYHNKESRFLYALKDVCAPCLVFHSLFFNMLEETDHPLIKSVILYDHPDILVFISFPSTFCH